MKKSFSVAVIQEGPVYYDLYKSLERAKELIEQAAQQQPDLIVLGECWLSGYPAWIDHCPSMALWDHQPTKQVFRRMISNSMTIPGPELEELAALCRKFDTGLCFGANERIDHGPGQGTMYNSLLILDEKGELQVHHRKLMPTFTEKLLYGLGDGYGLRHAEIKGVKVGGLICWEHWMPLARQAMHDSGELVHIALWPTVHDLHQLASRQYAVEGRCYVVAVGQLMQAKDIPQELGIPEHLSKDPSQFILRGGSAVIAPDSNYMLEPQFEKNDIHVVQLDLDKIWEERMTLDTTGHYQRKDVFQVEVDRTRR